jgi:uncharacterized protein (DUF433 family)
MVMKTSSQAIIEANPGICHGQPVFKGTRIMVWQILELLESGTSPKEIYDAYPSLPPRALEASLHFAAQRVKGLNYAGADLVLA